MLVLGIDPGFAICGYGLVNSPQPGRLEVVEYGVIRTDSDLSDAERLLIVYSKIREKIQAKKPNMMAIEQLYFNTNSKTVMTVSQARGVIILAAALETLLIREYTPLQVKQAVTGEGRAEKQQVEYMVKMLLNLKKPIKPDDAADALAVAICAINSETRPIMRIR